MTIRKLFVFLAVVVVTCLFADNASAACKTCGYYCLSSASQSGATKCVSHQNADGSWTCVLSDDQCSSSIGSGVSCTVPSDFYSATINPKNPPANVQCNWGGPTLPSVWFCQYDPGEVSCSGGGGSGGGCYPYTNVGSCPFWM
jgi:hypothetical protein